MTELEDVTGGSYTSNRYPTPRTVLINPWRWLARSWRSGPFAALPPGNFCAAAVTSKDDTHFRP